MKRTTLLSLVAGVLAASVHAQTPPPGCRGASCNVMVSVVDPCSPAPHPEPVQPTKGVPNVVIHWWIDDNAAKAGYTFGTNGIVPPTDPQFSPVTVATRTHVHLVDRNVTAGRYKYSINVQKNGSVCPTKDPYIVNN